MQIRLTIDVHLTAGCDDELHVDDVSDSDGAAADEDDDSDDKI